MKTRTGPLTGVGFLAFLISSFVVGGSPPEPGASTRTVAAFWNAHASAQIAAALLAGIAAVLLVWFAGVAQARLREAEGAPAQFSTTAFGGFMLIAAGGLALSGFQFTAAQTAGEVSDSVTETLSVLYQDFFFLLDGGVVIAVSATALAILRHDALPRWFGYASLAVAVAFLTPAFAVAFPAFGIWTITLSALVASNGAQHP